MDCRQHHVKRTLDLVAAVIGLLVLWPVILVCIALAARDTGLSGLYAQHRIGRYGRPFRIYKVRTMRHVDGFERNSVTTENDPRITALGHRLRRWKLDELPQLWNVLVGDMSIVGPRPDVSGYADNLVGEARVILDLRPGITGPATIKYRDEEQLLARTNNPVVFNDTVLYPDKVRLNIEYFRDWSLRKDIYYILITLGLMRQPQSLIADDSSRVKNS